WSVPPDLPDRRGDHLRPDAAADESGVADRVVHPGLVRKGTDGLGVVGVVGPPVPLAPALSCGPRRAGTGASPRSRSLRPRPTTVRRAAPPAMPRLARDPPRRA